MTELLADTHALLWWLAYDARLSAGARAVIAAGQVACTSARRACGRPRSRRPPFDGMLVAQARLEGLTVVTADSKLVDYGASVLW